MAIIVKRLMPDIEHRLVDVAHSMAEQIDSHHWQCMLAAGHHVVRIVILDTKILAEAQRLSLKPRLLKLNQYQLLGAVAMPYTRPEINAQDRHGVPFVVHILLWTHLYLQNVFFQKC